LLFANLRRLAHALVQVGSNKGCLTVPLVRVVGNAGERVLLYEPRRVLFKRSVRHPTPGVGWRRYREACKQGGGVRTPTCASCRRKNALLQDRFPVLRTTVGNIRYPSAIPQTAAGETTIRQTGFDRDTEKKLFQLHCRTDIFHLAVRRAELFPSERRRTIASMDCANWTRIDWIV